MHHELSSNDTPAASQHQSDGLFQWLLLLAQHLLRLPSCKQSVILLFATYPLGGTLLNIDL